MLGLTARAFLAEQATPAALTNIYNVLFSFDSWGVTLHHLCETKKPGGCELLVACTWLMVHVGLPLMAHLSESCVFPPVSVPHFNCWCDVVGLMMKLHVIPLLQLGSVCKPWQPSCFLACSFEALLEARKFVVTAPVQDVRALLAWYCAIFQNTHGRTHLAPQLVRRGILTID